MAGQILNNAQLETLAEEFVKDRQKEKYAWIMETVERSVLLVPIMQPRGLDEETQRLIREKKPVQLPKNASINPCLLRKETGEQALPVFTSAAQIPPERQSPAVLAMPFQVCLSMAMSEQTHVEAIVLNPFTHNIVMPRAILEVAVRRREAVKQSGTVKMTERQYAQLVHDRVAFQLLPKFLFDRKEEGLRRLQQEEGVLLMEFYRESYPEERRSSIAVREEDFSVMTLNITEDMQITRLDMPEEKEKKGACYRVYAVRLQEKKELFYFTLERTAQGNQIGRITSDGRHELMEAAPDNGAEIEAVIELVARI